MSFTVSVWHSLLLSWPCVFSCKCLQKEDLLLSSEQHEENMWDIVDLDDEAIEEYASNELLGQFLSNTVFRSGILAVILLNSLLIAVETDQELVSECLPDSCQALNVCHKNNNKWNQSWWPVMYRPKHVQLLVSSVPSRSFLIREKLSQRTVFVLPIHWLSNVQIKLHCCPNLWMKSLWQFIVSLVKFCSVLVLPQKTEVLYSGYVSYRDARVLGMKSGIFNLSRKQTDRLRFCFLFDSCTLVVYTVYFY